MGQDLALCWLARNTIIALRIPLGWGTVKRGTVENQTVRHGTVEHGTVENQTVKHGTVKHGTVKNQTMKHGTVKHGTVENQTVKHGTVKHGTVSFSKKMQDFGAFSSFSVSQE